MCRHRIPSPERISMTAHIEAARARYARTREEKFALGAFNMDNHETLIAIARGRYQAGPRARGGLERRGAELGLQNGRCLVDNYRHEYGIEMYLNLDHAPSVEAAKAGIDAGFEFTHIDVSQAKRDATA